MEISVKIEPDADGYTGRECPACEKYFKIKFGTGLPGEHDCHCPYCNHTGPQQEFWAKQQIAYAQSVAMRQFWPLPDGRRFTCIGCDTSH